MRVLAVDVAGDVAAALLWKRGRVLELALFENRDGQWRGCGGGAAEGVRRGEAFRGRPSAVEAGPAGILELQGSAFARRRGSGPAAAGRVVAGHRLLVAREVSYLDVGGRRVGVPAHGRVVVAWEAPAGLGAAVSLGQPEIVACGSDGTVLSELAPGGFVDTATLDAASA